jgi:hypothetical protein
MMERYRRGAVKLDLTYILKLPPTKNWRGMMMYVCRGLKRCRRRLKEVDTGEERRVEVGGK